MFTAVDLLDGESMVGCRRCCKIAVKGNELWDGEEE